MSGGEIFIFGFIAVFLGGGAYVMYRFVKANRRDRKAREQK
jgi:hypothetical protein